jgi:hypothetical protein
MAVGQVASSKVVVRIDRISSATNPRQQVWELVLNHLIRLSIHVKNDKQGVHLRLRFDRLRGPPCTDVTRKLDQARTLNNEESWTLLTRHHHDASRCKLVNAEPFGINGISVAGFLFSARRPS